jgi:hypothetical protein
LLDKANHPGGGIAVGGPPPKKIAENCGKIAEIAEKMRKKLRFFSKGNCGRDLEKFRFPDSGQGKGAPKNCKSKPGQNPAENFFHVFVVNFHKF